MSGHENDILAEPSRKQRIGYAIGNLYQRLYGLIAGRLPYLRPWHAQWLGGRPLVRVMRRVLEPLGGQVLDVGCGERPYERWMTKTERYVGLDVVPGPHVDLVVDPAKPWPLNDGEFDTVLCLQVLEHVREPELLLSEIERVLRPGGHAVVAVPFAYTEHDDPHDYRRLSRHGLAVELGRRFDVLEVTPIGAVGSTMGMFLLNFLELCFLKRPERTLVLILLLPLWLLLCAVVNAVGFLLDRVDRTNACYSNVVAVVAKV